MEKRMQRKITSSFLAKIGGKIIEDTVSESGERKKDKHIKEKPQESIITLAIVPKYEHIEECKGK